MAATAVRRNIPAQLQPVRFEAFDPAQGRNAVAKTTYKVANFVLHYLETIVNNLITYFNAALQIADRFLNRQTTQPIADEPTAFVAAASAPATPVATDAAPVEEPSAPATPVATDAAPVEEPSAAAPVEEPSAAAPVEEPSAPATPVATDEAPVEESPAPATSASESADANEPDYSNSGPIVKFFRWATGYSAADSE